MNDVQCVEFLQRTLPRLRMRWAGFRRVRGQVGKRLARRLRELHLGDLGAYETYLESNRDEWARLDELCRITISRFYRDRAVGRLLGTDLLPAMARLAGERGDGELRCFSAGCGAGEEPYTLALIWHLSASSAFPGLDLRVIAWDADELLLERARTAIYPASSLRDLDEELRRPAFDRHGDEFRLRAEYQCDVEFHQRDLRRCQPDTGFHLVLCRNLVFTYYDLALQSELLERFAESLIPGGALIVGARERLPRFAAERTGFTPWRPELGVYRREESR